MEPTFMGVPLSIVEQQRQDAIRRLNELQGMLREIRYRKRHGMLSPEQGSELQPFYRSAYVAIREFDETETVYRQWRQENDLPVN